MSHNYPRTPAQQLAAREWAVASERRDLRVLAQKLNRTREGARRDALMAELAHLKESLANNIETYRQTLAECDRLEP